MNILISFLTLILDFKIKFSTLGQYFESLLETNRFPSLSGDFFTYCDRDDHYWSGFYTSKPFFKRFERILESHLRSAEIIYSLASILNTRSLERLNSFIPSLVYARQNLALFQHHDGITGTAKDVVVNDYANRYELCYAFNYIFIVLLIFLFNL